MAAVATRVGRAETGDSPATQTGGGADSMALAHLCKQWENSQHSQGDDITVTAFVVDHKAREESSREAILVSKWLRDMGVKTEILELSWPQSNSPVTAFETHARRLRFQALGKACRDRQIDALLMGHHRDDNVETTLWRLCSGARGAGLAGIPPMTRIPECHGIYGVSESGSSAIIRPRKMYSHKLHITPKNEIYALCNDDPKPKMANPQSMSTGGIFICRPLLDFPKTSLLATCHENNIPYVSDPTNFDPTLTPRNAIRSMISSELISPFPENHFPLRSFENFNHRVFPPTCPDDIITSTDNRQAFTLGGVMFQPLHWPQSPSSQSAEAPPKGDLSVWFLSRQPYMRNRLPISRYDPHISLFENYTPWSLWDERYWIRFVVRPDSTSHQSETGRIMHQPPRITFIVRPFQPSDLQTARQILQDDQLRLGRQPRKGKDPAMVKFLGRLAQDAPGQIRFRLPLVAIEMEVDGAMHELPLALPTLELWLPGMREAFQRISGPQSHPWTVHWEWMYKMVDTEALEVLRSL
ncbi:hypothetical protein FE257_007321 [Aspergillus nanangensis]|uniref:tRNA(Ile)-lysidine synthetase n=1 Tax=Aspergillus nanangensis TaxID=2582783 RepID=A0AAD4GU93_ASPNN|nr:hypothetical protein FE257_007321 [Aspergillus nanangensis]